MNRMKAEDGRRDVGLLAAYRDRLSAGDLFHLDPQRLFSDVYAEVQRYLAIKRPYPEQGDFFKSLSEAAESFDCATSATSIGTVSYIGNGVATISGLPQVKSEELVEFPGGVQGMVLSLDRDHADVILLGRDQGIRGGDIAYGTGKRLRVPVGVHFSGRTIDPLGRPLDGGKAIVASENRIIERVAPGIVDRAPIDEPIYSGTKVIDALIPIGKGQRELILGDRQTGKTTLAIDMILSQKNTDVKCIYVSIAQKKTSVLSAIEAFRAGGVLDQTIVIVAGADDAPALRYIAPYCGVTMAEFFLDQGMDVLIVYDDLSKHADSYRELSLLLRRPPGREAYPGDIFYLHSRLLERACRLNHANGGGSITAIPIATTQGGNISAYIPTNLISITDGQIMLDADRFNKGQKPAIDIGRSVSRVGGAAQVRLMKRIVGSLKLELSQYDEIARFAKFGTDVNETTKRQLRRGEQIMALFAQGPNRPVPPEIQIIGYYALLNDFLEEIEPENVQEFVQDLVSTINRYDRQILDEIANTGELSDPSEDQLQLILEQFCQEREQTRAISGGTGAG